MGYQGNDNKVELSQPSERFKWGTGLIKTFSLFPKSYILNRLTLNDIKDAGHT